MKFQVFRRFEYPAEVSRFKHFNATLHQKRQDLIERILSNDFQDLTEEFYEYEKILEDSFVAGIPAGAPRYAQENVKWTHLKAVFFSSTVLTTIGKFTSIYVYSVTSNYTIIFLRLKLHLRSKLSFETGTKSATK